MSEPVKTRSYNSPVRREQAARTRQRILDAAGDLFARQGYGTTSVRQIADAAQVAPDTVYATFGSKARLLTALVDIRLAPGGQASVLDRPEIQALRQERDPRRLLRLFARDYAAMSERVRPVSEVLRTAKAVEPEMGSGPRGDGRASLAVHGHDRAVARRTGRAARPGRPRGADCLGSGQPR